MLGNDRRKILFFIVYRFHFYRFVFCTSVIRVSFVLFILFKMLLQVEEGVELFEETMAKMHEANSDNQREKFQRKILQDDFKKEEIKKLQRLRDQIKGWQNSSDIKIIYQMRYLEDEVDKTESQIESLSTADQTRKKGLLILEHLESTRVMDALKESFEMYIESLNPESENDSESFDSEITGVYDELDLQSYTPQLDGAIFDSSDSDEKMENNIDRRISPVASPTPVVPKETDDDNNTKQRHLTFTTTNISQQKYTSYTVKTYQRLTCSYIIGVRAHTPINVQLYYRSTCIYTD
uniref:Not3 domain-containing protein n=1 Tax=Onchocerca volvulus TaxID=6282 RepID=A0A8R1TYX1_ONCVO